MLFRTGPPHTFRQGERPAGIFFWEEGKNISEKIGILVYPFQYYMKYFVL